MMELAERTVVIPNYTNGTTKMQDISEVVYDTSSLPALALELDNVRRVIRKTTYVAGGTSIGMLVASAIALWDGVTRRDTIAVLESFSGLIGTGFGGYFTREAWLEKSRYDRRIAAIQSASSELSSQEGNNPS